MNRTYQTDWNAFDAMSDDEILTNAMTDPEAPPLTWGAKVKMRREDGATVLERFRKAVKREGQKHARGVGKGKISCQEN